MSPRLPYSSTKLFICPRCQIRANARLLSITPSHIQPSPTAPHDELESIKPKYARLSNRNIIQLTGPDAPDFLHNLLPAKILDRPPESERSPIYTAFLNAQGRVLNDVFVYPPPKSAYQTQPWFIEVDGEHAGDLMKHLRKHKLRSKFQLERLTPEASSVYYTWPRVGDDGGQLRGQNGGPDPRPGMGSRWIISSDSSQSGALLKVLDSDGIEATVKDYTIHRMLNGIAEGQIEIESSAALPMDSNIDFFGGIDFHKGCYVGQELTIRTHHTGVVRKRILPCQIYNEEFPLSESQDMPIHNEATELTLPPPQSNMTKLSSSGRGRGVGKWLDGVGNIGLALCRLEMTTDLRLSGDSNPTEPVEEFKVAYAPDEDGSLTQHVLVKPFLPQWLRDGIMQGIERRSRKSRKDRDEEEEGNGVD